MKKSNKANMTDLRRAQNDHHFNTRGLSAKAIKRAMKRLAAQRKAEDAK